MSIHFHRLHPYEIMFYVSNNLSLSLNSIPHGVVPFSFPFLPQLTLSICLGMVIWLLMQGISKARPQMRMGLVACLFQTTGVAGHVSRSPSR